MNLSKRDKIGIGAAGAAVAAAAAATTIFLMLGPTNIWFVRNGGGSPSQCTGKTNADYPGTGTGVDCAYSNPQDAFNAATFGDTIEFHAGDTFRTTPAYAFGEFRLPNKGTPPTGTDADYIILTTDDQ